jgi:hypothetical protein
MNEYFYFKTDAGSKVMTTDWQGVLWTMTGEGYVVNLICKDQAQLDTYEAMALVYPKMPILHLKGQHDPSKDGLRTFSFYTYNPDAQVVSRKLVRG